MKILFINTFYAPHNVGGAENSLRFIAEGMQKKGHKVTVLVTSTSKGLKIENINGIKVYRASNIQGEWIYGKKSNSFLSKLIWFIQDFYNPTMNKYLSKVIAIEEPDIISCHNIRGWSVAIWDEIRRQAIPTVQVLHDYYLLCRRGMMFNNGQACSERCFQCQILKSIHKRKSRKIDAVVGVCQDILQRNISAGYFSNSLKNYVYNIRKIPNNNICDRDKSAHVFGFIGTLTENKGIIWLIEEFQKTKNIDISLVIAGKGNREFEEILKRKAEKDNRISFLGHVNSLEFYNKIDVLIIPSIWHEPLASVAIEACANHIPVITSGMGGLKEIIIDNVNGLICQKSDTDSLSAAIYLLSKDQTLYSKLRHSARESIMPFMDVERLVNEYESVYYQIKRKH